MAKVYHRPGDAKVLHDYPLLLSSSGDADRVVFLSERDYNIIHNCLELTAKLRKRVFYTSDGPIYDVVGDTDWLTFVSWVEDLENNLGGWQLSNLLLERIAIALESLDAKQEDIMTVEGFLNKLEDLYGIGSAISAIGHGFADLLPSLAFKVKPTDIYFMVSDMMFKSALLAALGALTAAVASVTTAIAAHLPIAAASALLARILGIADLLLTLETQFQNWWAGETVTWGDILSDIWNWITGSGEEEQPLDPSDQIQVRQAVALESIATGVTGIKNCVCNSSNPTNGGSEDMSTVVNVYNGCCPNCGGTTGNNPADGSGSEPPTQSYPTLPPWEGTPQPTPDSFPTSFGTMENWLAYRCQVAHAIFEVMKQTTATFSVSNMVAWIAASWTLGWQSAAGSIQAAITSSILGSILLPSGGLAGLAIGILNVIRTHQNFIYNMAFFNSFGLAAWMDENKEAILCHILEATDYNYVYEVFQNEVMEEYGATEETEDLYTEVFRWLLPPALSSALFRDARAEIDLSSVAYNITLCACDPASSGIGGTGTYEFCELFSGNEGGQFSGPVPSGTGESGWTSNDGATVTQGEDMALMNYPSATITGVNGLHVNFANTALVEGDLISWFCVAISLGFNDFRCEVQQASDDAWHLVDENLGVIQGSGSYINFVIPPELDAVEVKAARLLIKGQNFCNVSHMYIGDTPCA